MSKHTILLAVACLFAFAGAAFGQVPPPFDLVAQSGGTAIPAVELTWQAPVLDPPGHLFFRVNRSDGDSLHYAGIAIVTARRFTDYHVMTGHTYFYTVNAIVLMGDSDISESAPSNTAWATVAGPVQKPHGVISGTVTDSTTGMPVPLVRIEFFRISSPRNWIPQAITGSLGKYRAVLDTGTYLVRAEPSIFPMLWMIFPIPIYLPEWYNDVLDVADATPITVGDSTEFTADFHLKRLRQIPLAAVRGTVTDTSGMPLKGALVVIARTFKDMEALSAWGGDLPGLDDADLDLDDIGHVRGVLWRGWTDSLGNYTAHVLGGLDYIAFADKKGYLPQFFDHESDFRDADVIELRGDTSGIDFSLTPRPKATGSVAGVVQDSSGVRVASRVILIPLSKPWKGRFGTTDSMGAYLFSAVPAGDYFVLAIPYAGYAPAFYKAGAFGVLHWQQADTVQVGTGAVTGIDIGVVPIMGGGLATISGSVMSQGSPVPGANVVAMDGQGNVVGYAMTDNSGAYTLDAIPAGANGVIVDDFGYLPASGYVNVGLSQTTIAGQNYTLTPTTPTGVTNPNPSLPTRFALDQNYPNPFNPSTKIGFSLPATSNVSLRVFNVLGQEIATLVNAVLPAGRQEVVWGGRDDAGRAVASGVYFYRLEASSPGNGQQFTSFRKMVLLK